jgi:hypothetical protein
MDNQPFSQASQMKRASHGFTTLKGWRDMGSGLYQLAGQLRYVPRNQDLGTPLFVGAPASGTSAAGTPFYTSPNLPHTTLPSSASFGGRGHSFASANPPQPEEQLELQLSREESPVENPLNQPSTPPSEPEKANTTPTKKPPYHISTPRQKKLLVYIVSLISVFSPLSAYIYLPALETIARVSYPHEDANGHFNIRCLPLTSRTYTSVYQWLLLL